MRDATSEVPKGWTGKWRDARCGSVRVFFSAGGWTLQQHGKRVSRHDSRNYALAKGRKLLAQEKDPAP
jgi:hypothetical protein